MVRKSPLTNDAESAQYLTLTLVSYHILNMHLKWGIELHVNSILMCITPSLHRWVPSTFHQFSMSEASREPSNQEVKVITPPAHKLE